MSEVFDFAELTWALKLIFAGILMSGPWFGVVTDFGTGDVRLGCYCCVPNLAAFGLVTDLCLVCDGPADGSTVEA